MQLFKIPTPPQDLTCNPEPEALAERDALLAHANTIQAVTTREDNEQVSLIGSNLQRMLKGIESTRKDITAPYLAAQKLIKATADSFCEPLTKALDRLGRLASVFRVEQERVAEAERQKRADDLARLQEQERKAAEEVRRAAEANDLMGGLMADIKATALTAAVSAAVISPVFEATKIAGQSFRPDEFDFEVTDINALWAARPEFCNPPTAKRAAIKACCGVTSQIPGLRFFPAPKVNFKSK